MIVLDASALLELLLQTPKGAIVGERTLSADERLHAPHLIDIEVAQTLRRLAQAKSLTAARAGQALTDFADLTIERHEHSYFLPRIWQLRDSLTAYDATYVALAEALDAPLLTCDGKLARAHGHHARVTLV